jgi:FAD/FMN-containing dehydrogenase
MTDVVVLPEATDVAVPTSELPHAVRNSRWLVDVHGLAATLMAHAGDGNFQVCSWSIPPRMSPRPSSESAR